MDAFFSAPTSAQTASINWNLLSAYMKGTNWWRAGLFTAFQPWSGNFGALSMVWATAHTTQFATPGAYSYLANGTGAGTGSGLLGESREFCCPPRGLV